MIKKILGIRYIFIIAVIFLLLNAIVFTFVGVRHCIHGYIGYVEIGFSPEENLRPGMHLLEALDSFMVALVFMIFGLGIGRLFLFPDSSGEHLPRWLQINNLKELKVLLWETILLTMVIFCVSNMISGNTKSWELLLFPGVILILSLSLFLMRGKEKN
ncbi:MAG: YqhA family protein [Ferruginibacter sp.]